MVAEDHELNSKHRGVDPILESDAQASEWDQERMTALQQYRHVVQQDQEEQKLL